MGPQRNHSLRLPAPGIHSLLLLAAHRTPKIWASLMPLITLFAARYTEAVLIVRIVLCLWRYARCFHSWRLGETWSTIRFGQ